MKRIPVNSSNVKSVGYNSILKLLEVEFNNGSVYEYIDVPKELYDAFISSDSLGKFVHSHLKNKFRTIQVAPGLKAIKRNVRSVINTIPIKWRP